MSADPAAVTSELSTAELAVIQGRLSIGGLFGAHAHTDVTRLLAEVRRLRQLVADLPPGEPSTDGGSS